MRTAGVVDAMRQRGTLTARMLMPKGSLAGTELTKTLTVDSSRTADPSMNLSPS
jgi:hypothetical protein